MKLHKTSTKFLVSAVFVLGLVVPATAQHMPQPYKSVEDNIVDWWDEYEYMDSTRVPVNVSKENSYSNTYGNESQNKTARLQGAGSSEDLQNQSMTKKQYDTSWMILEDW